MASASSSATTVDRITWDPKHSDAVRIVLDEIVQRFRSGELKDEFRPETLIDQLGGKFSRFYHAACKRERPSDWAKERFPNGFESVFEEVRARLAEEGITILNTQQKRIRFQRLPQDEIDIIGNFREQIVRGLLSRDEAITLLERDFGIKLTKEQAAYHLQGSSGTSTAAGLEDRKRELLNRVERLQNELGVNLSIESCLRGIVFEGFVGTFLADRFGVRNVECQVARPIVYRDLAGNPHSYVYLDYKVKEGESTFVLEVKSANTFENIVTSVLSQLAALQGEEGAPDRISVVYRRPCPLMKMGLDENLSVIHEAREMELTLGNRHELKLRDVLTYISIDELLARNEGAEAFRRCFEQLDTFLDVASPSALRAYAEAFRLISRIEGPLTDQITKITEWLESAKVPTQAELRRFFDRDQVPSGEEERGLDRRLEIIMRQARSIRDKVILEIYERKFGVRPAMVDAGTLSALEGLPEQEFAAVAFDYISDREARQRRLLEARFHTNSTVAHEGKVLEAYDRIKERQRVERIEQVYEFRRELGSRSSAHYEQLVNADAQCPPIMNSVLSPSETVMILVKEGGLPPRPAQQMVTEFNTISKRMAQIESQTVANARQLNADWISDLASKVLTSQVNEDLSFRQGIAFELFRGSVSEFRREFERTMADLPHRDYIEAVARVAEKARTKSSNLSRRERDHLKRLHFMLSGKKAAMAIDAIATIPEMHEPFFRLSPLAGCASFAECNVALSRGEYGDGLVYSAEVQQHVLQSITLNCVGLEYATVNDGLVLQGIPSDPEAQRAFLSKRLSPYLRQRIGGNVFAERDGRGNELELKSIEPMIAKIIDSNRELLASRRGEVTAPGKLQVWAGIFTGLVQQVRMPATDCTGDILRGHFSHVTREVHMSEILPGLIRDRTAELMRECTAGGVFTADAIADYFSRRVHQAKVIGYFAPDLAQEFLADSYIPAGIQLQGPEAISAIRELNRQQDELFSGLVGGSRGQ